MPHPYLLSIINEKDQKMINFVNNSPDFIEVIFMIDGREVKEGEMPNNTTRGYGYPPKLEKQVRKMKDGTPIKLPTHRGKVQAMIFQGIGSYKDKDLDKPTFIRHKLVDRFSFRRTSNKPIAVLEVKY
ncbi:MAG: hypothetical protein Q8N09_11550 [Thermodesulfovibrionia bacterium]|nr:hypothetical protein [Thermodesulfovibrionia bacterium]